MDKIEQQSKANTRWVEQYFFEYLTGKRDENSAIACIADIRIRGQELRDILNRVYDGTERTDLREERVRSIRQRLNRNGF